MHNAYRLLVIGYWLLSLFSCSHIDENERLIYVPMPQAGRCILIEDFTGQRCINCPDATSIVEGLQEEYTADTIIAVAIHSGPLGVMPSEDNPDGLATELGNTYYDHWECQYQPVGLIDRSDGLLDKDIWTAKAAWDLQQESDVNILVDADWTEAGNIDIRVQIVGTEGSATGKLQVWLTEDHITAFQKMPDGTTKANYEHNHVLRDAVNGIWGEDCTLNEGEVTTFDYSYALHSGWVPGNMSVIAFLYNDDGVVQVTRKKIEIKK